MTVCGMSLNGFLQILDLKIFRVPRLLRIGQRPHRRVVRVLGHTTGAWVLFTFDGACHDAHLIGGWALARGRLLGLRWQTADGQCLYVITSAYIQTPDVGRRLLVRLRWPLPDPVACT
jgi:hypothetical protein